VNAFSIPQSTVRTVFPLFGKFSTSSSKESFLISPLVKHLPQKSKMSDEKLFLGKFAHVEGFYLQSSQFPLWKSQEKQKKTKSTTKNWSKDDIYEWNCFQEKLTTTNWKTFHCSTQRREISWHFVWCTLNYHPTLSFNRSTSPFQNVLQRDFSTFSKNFVLSTISSQNISNASFCDKDVGSDVINYQNKSNSSLGIRRTKKLIDKSIFTKWRDISRKHLKKVRWKKLLLKQ